MIDPLRPVRAVLFDAVGTIMTPAPAVSDAYLNAGRRHGAQLSREVVSQRFSAAFQKSRTSTAPTNEALERETWRQIVREVFPDVAESERLFHELWDHFADPTHWRVFDDVQTSWQRLQEMGLTLGIASNFDKRLVEICDAHAPMDTCTHRFWSAQLQSRKPSSDFFTRITETLGLDPAEMLMIGDDVTNDYFGARQAGWQSLLVVRKPGRSRAPEIPANHVIKSLEQVAELLASAGMKSSLRTINGR